MSFWYGLVLVDLVVALCMLVTVIGEKPEEVRPTIQHIRYIKETNSSEHKEVLECGKLLDESKVYMLAHLIYGESGSDWCSDEMQLGVGSVVLNRIKSPYFPDTMEEVIFQTGQYSCTNEGSGYWLEPNERAFANARYLLENGSQFPDNVLFQAQFLQGDGLHKKVGNQYFCIKN